MTALGKLTLRAQLVTQGKEGQDRLDESLTHLDYLVFFLNNPQSGYFCTVNFAYAQSAITQAVAGYTGDRDRMHSARSKFPVQVLKLCHQIQ